MFSREFSVDINAPVEQVWAYVTDLRRHPEWSNNAMEMAVHSEPVAVGTTFETSVKAFGTETAKGKVIEMQRPSKFVYESDTSTSGHWRWTMTLELIAGGTRLRHKSEGLRRPGWMKVMQPLMFPLIGKKMQMSGLQNIKARVEAGGGKEAASAG